jgi:SAM-dependent methyltransferase
MRRRGGASHARGLTARARRAKVAGVALDRARADQARQRWTSAVLRAYDRSAAGYDERFGALQRDKYRVMLAGADAGLRDALARGRVLDLGCGTGLLPEFARGLGFDTCRWLGADGSAVMLAHARRRGLAVAQAEIERLPFADAAFDAVLALTVLRLDGGDDAPALVEIARVLAPGGRLVVTVLAERHEAGFAAALGHAGLAPGAPRRCGQDVGYVCVRAPLTAASGPGDVSMRAATPAVL